MESAPIKTTKDGKDWKHTPETRGNMIRTMAVAQAPRSRHEVRCTGTSRWCKRRLRLLQHIEGAHVNTLKRARDGSRLESPIRTPISNVLDRLSGHRPRVAPIRLTHYCFFGNSCTYQR
jgi:hypothetical protein